jgi:osmoprotectant transport system permease protein
MKARWPLLILFLLAFLLLFLIIPPKSSIRIGSKRFTESYILGEILAQIAIRSDEKPVDFRQGLGNTGITYSALKNNLIDIYPEYTGSIAHDILHYPLDQPFTIESLRRDLAPLNLGISQSLGFNNSYGLAMLQEKAERLNIKRLSDLAKLSDLRLGFSQEFLGRVDGWQGLQKKLSGFNARSIVGIDHALGYEALLQDKIDVMDIYTTDPKIGALNLVVLEDDLHFFPSYEAVLFYRLEAAETYKKTWGNFQKLAGKISIQTMQQLNAEAEIQGFSFAQIAQKFLNGRPNDFLLSRSTLFSYLFDADLWGLTRQHLFLVFASLFPAIIVGILLGILTSYSMPLRHLILNAVGMIQTIPSIALLAFLIPLFNQIGTIPALAALFLYALLPIVRNTYAGITSIPKPLQDSAEVLGLSFPTRLVWIMLPLSSRTILAGIKTAAVINVGMATIAAFIGAGGYGDRIVAGLALNNYNMLLAGAIPACSMALLIQISFDWIDKYLIPKGIQ